jgi:hypothetical protein
LLFSATRQGQWSSGQKRNVTACRIELGAPNTMFSASRLAGLPPAGAVRAVPLTSSRVGRPAELC